MTSRSLVNEGSPVIVLGMHRSGTSALTGSLEEAGLALGPVIESAADNAKGSRESRRLMTLHEDILVRNGGAWNRPVNNASWSPVHRELRDSVIESFQGVASWGFKDPRTLLVLNGWLTALPAARLVGIFRHPLAVAQSLQRRNDMPLDEALSLWIAYNRVLSWHHEHHGPFPLLEFSDDDRDFVGQTRELAAHLGLDAPPETFYDASLRQPVDLDAVMSEERGPEMVRALRLLDTLRERRGDANARRVVRRS